MQIHQLADLNGTGAAQQITATVIQARWVKIKALAANTGTVRIGDSAVTSTSGFPLAKGEFTEYPLDGGDITDRYNLNQIYVFSANGDSISVSYGC